MAIHVIRPNADHTIFNAPTERETRGWKNVGGGAYRGLFVTKKGSFWGFATKEFDQTIKIYIYAPPQQLRRHPKWGCFHPVKPGWFEVHISPKPKSIDAAILKVENMLSEALE